MKRYKVILLVPHEHIIEAEDLGKAHTEAYRLSQVSNTADGAPKAVLHSCIEIRDVADFGPSPANVA